MRQNEHTSEIMSVVPDDIITVFRVNEYEKLAYSSSASRISQFIEHEVTIKYVNIQCQQIKPAAY